MFMGFDVTENLSPLSESPKPDYTDLAVEIAGMKLHTCLSNVSGILSFPPSYLKELSKEKSLGLLFSKSTSSKRREGYPNPTLYLDPGRVFALNAFGVPCPGVYEMKRELSKIYPLQVPLFNSVFFESPEDLALIIKELYKVSDGFELNLSCHHLEAGEKMGIMIGRDPELTKECARAAKRAAREKPVIAKLSADVPDIKSIARAAVEGGADGISAINTVGPGMKIDINAMKPVLARKAGGMSGPAVFPIAVRCIYEIKEEVVNEAFIVGEGGVSCWEDTIELILVGADIVGIGTVTAYEGKIAYPRIARGMIQYLARKDLTLNEIKGAAHCR